MPATAGHRDRACEVAVEHGTDPTRMTARKWYLITGGWSLLLVPWVYAAVVSDHGWPVRVLLVAVVLLYGGGYTVGLYQAMWRRRVSLSSGVLVAMAALWVAMITGLGTDHGNATGVLYTISFLLAALLVLLPRRVGAVAALLACAGGVVLVQTLTGPLDYGEIIGLVAMTFAMIGMFGLIKKNSQLREAREELARLAVTAERERMARDLHDVLGHSLTTITVKAGLARRLLERGDPARAAEEVADVERLGRQALAEVRATVAANRVASLGAELAGAREALRASGIEADLPRAVDDVPAERQQVFAYVLREGVTNTIRHSGAGRCTVRLTADGIEIADDGVGASAGTPAGNGLSGLAERLAAVGGWLDAGPGEQGGYRLRAQCPPARGRAVARVGPSVAAQAS